MCGQEATDRPRGGALAALSAPGSDPQSRTSLRGDLAFHTPGEPGSCRATHARFTPGEQCRLGDRDRLRVVIHSIGDLTRAADDCGLFRQFTLGHAHAHAHAHSSTSARHVELPLDPPLLLEVGDGGIIGRRVSVSWESRSGSEALVAEGIVGFNFLEQRSTAV
ncbi:hypothetical protein E4U41_003990 [Claviceps citrina]|nr:hypothetical protein E4U41_003990 [Claviceps citrina]